MYSDTKIIEDLTQTGILEMRSRNPSIQLLNLEDLLSWVREEGYAYLHSAWASSLYGVYRKNLEPLGDKIVWIETGCRYTFMVPDILISADPRERPASGIRLRDFAGIAVFELDQLIYDADKKLVSVIEESVMKKPVRLVPVTSKPPGVPEAGREGIDLFKTSFPLLASAYQYQSGSNGWHGSVIVNTLDPLHEAGDDLRTDVELCHLWTQRLKAVGYSFSDSENSLSGR